MEDFTVNDRLNKLANQVRATELAINEIARQLSLIAELINVDSSSED